ncbi:MAG: glycosyltransferase family 2 protein [Clostridia bacterium]|nr:glycosyltransferase family 2 protein [Clostridia bacterium]
MSSIADNKVLTTVSVVMPAYNAAAYIEEAIRSVMDQTFTDWELVVVDDASTDDTCAVVRRLMTEDPRIRLVQNATNMGVAHTRNHGLDICHGEYVALLDGDDIWLPNKLEAQLALAAESGADILYCSYGIVDECGAPRSDDFIVPPTITYRETLSCSVISCSTAMLSRRVVEKHRFRTDYYHEDLVLWLELLRNGYTAGGVTDVLAQYRVSPHSRASNKIKSAVRRWIVIRRCMREPFFSSVGAMWRYAVLAGRKYKKIQPTTKKG